MCVGISKLGLCRAIRSQCPSGLENEDVLIRMSLEVENEDRTLYRREKSYNGQVAHAKMTILIATFN